MAGRKRIDTFVRDNLIVDIIKGRVGIENAIKSPEISKILSSNGYQISANSIHIIISKIIRERNLPILSSSSWGYCWGNRREDFLVSISELKSKVQELNERINHLTKFIID